MTRHIPRHARWSKLGPNEYTSSCGAVRFHKGAWWAWVAYRQLPSDTVPDGPQEWQQRCDRLGPFKRPRNAMMAAEQHAILLQRRYGDQVMIGSPDRN